MKIIDAIWEKRNLGVSAAEIIIQSEDNVREASEMFDQLNKQYEYVVIKLPVCRVDISFALAKMGFTYVETMVHLTHNMGLEPLDYRKQNSYNHMDFLPMSDKDMDEMYAEIRKGLFRTDRVSLDPFFTQQQVANRYVGWMSDELKCGSEVYKLVYFGENAGFVGFKKVGDTEYQDFLNGIYSDFQGKGLAFNLTYKLIKELQLRKASALHIDISSNNSVSLQARLRHGFEIDTFTYVYVKHNKGHMS